VLKIIKRADSRAIKNNKLKKCGNQEIVKYYRKLDLWNYSEKIDNKW